MARDWMDNYPEFGFVVGLAQFSDGFGNASLSKVRGFLDWNWGCTGL
jgi:hypothetical protein